MTMQSNFQRRRQQEVLRPRQLRNDVNTGAMPQVTLPHETLPQEGAVPEQAATPEERQDLYTKRCAQRHLI